MMRVGMLTSGGDCQSLNATMRGVAKALYRMYDDVEIIGFEDGYKGLIYADYRVMQQSEFSGILTEGGTILGTSRQPFKLMRVPDKDGIDKVEAMKHTYHKLHLDCLVVLGGNGTHKTANLLREEGLNVVTLPKTIDNDLWGTDMTFGFQSAVDIATDTIDRIHTTATSHNRVFIIEIMGHKVGWVTLHAGIAGGGDIILLPEIPYDLNVIAEYIKKRSEAGKRFTIIAVAEGAVAKEDAELPKKKLKEVRNKREESITVEENDVTTGYMPKEVDDLQNGPIIEQSSEQYKQMYNTAATYIRDNLNINPKTKLSVYDAIDPTVLEIYTAEDRGYLQDYTVENIYVLEYQKEDGTWSYIFMGRENKQSPWKVVHSGDHFKE